MFKDDENGGVKNIAVIPRHPVFDEVCAKFELDPVGMLSHLKAKGLIFTARKGYTKTCRINGITQNCVWLSLPAESNDSSRQVYNAPPHSDADAPFYRKGWSVDDE